MNETKAFEMHADNLYILGAWLAYERRKQGYSLRGLARGSNVAASLISAIENQKSKANLDTLKYLFEALHHSFVTDDAYLNSVSENIQALYYAVYEQNDAMISPLYAGIKEHLKTLKYSPITVDLILVEAFMQIHFEKEPVSEAFKALFNHENYLSTVQKQRLYLNQGYIAFHDGEYKEAKGNFERVLKIHRPSRAHAVALTMLAHLRLRDFDALSAMHAAKEASQLHAQYSNLFRKVEVDFTLIQCHITLNQLSYAESIIQNLSYVLVESNRRYWPELQAFKAYVAYRKKEYPLCIQILSTLEEKSVLQTVLLAQSYVHTQDMAKAMDAYKTLKTHFTLAPHEQALIRMMMTQFEDTPLSDEDFDQLLKNPKQFVHLHVVQTLIEVLSDYAYHHHDSEALYKLQKLSLKLMKFE